MKKCIVYVISLAAVIGYAQGPDIIWTKTYGGAGDDVGYSVQQTFDGGYIIVGETHSFGAGDADVWLLKTDENGDTVWTKTFGGSGFDGGYSGQQTTDGGYIIVGETGSFGGGGSNVWLIKTDVDGNTVWTQTFGGASDDGGYEVQQTFDEGYIITGRTNLWDAAWLLKTDSSGDTLWTQTYSHAMFNAGTSVQQTSDSGYIFTMSTSEFWTGSQGMSLIKTDAIGDTMWTERYGGLNSNSVQQTSDGGYVFTGQDVGRIPQCNVRIVKTDSLGNNLWDQSYGDTVVANDGGRSIQQTSDGGYIVAGYTNSFGGGSGIDAYLLKTDVNGDTIWTMTFSRVGDDEGNSVQQTSDGGYIVVGYTETFGAGNSDVWLIKTEPDVGIEEDETNIAEQSEFMSTIIHGPLRLPEGKKCRVFDITGRVVDPSRITRGIYFVAIDNKVVQKVVKIR